MNPNKYIHAVVSNYKDFVLALEKENIAAGSRSERRDKSAIIERNILKNIGRNIKHTIKIYGVDVIYDIDLVKSETDDKIYLFAVVDVISKNNTLQFYLYFKDAINK